MSEKERQQTEYTNEKRCLTKKNRVRNLQINF